MDLAVLEYQLIDLLVYHNKDDHVEAEVQATQIKDYQFLNYIK